MTYAVANSAKIVLARWGIAATIVPFKRVPENHCGDTKALVVTPGDFQNIHFGLQVGDKFYTTFE